MFQDFILFFSGLLRCRRCRRVDVLTAPNGATAAAGGRTLRKHWTAVLLGLLCFVSCTTGINDLDTEEPMPGQSAAVHRFVDLNDGTVRDKRTGLQWTSHDNGRDFNWHQADRYCRRLTLGGRTDWRLPEIDELKGLYDEGRDQPCGKRKCYLDPAVWLTNPYFWSATQRGLSRRFYIDFQFGTTLSPRLRPGLRRRVLCVRRFAL